MASWLTLPWCTWCSSRQLIARYGCSDNRTRTRRSPRRCTNHPQGNHLSHQADKCSILYGTAPACVMEVPWLPIARWSPPQGNANHSLRVLGQVEFYPTFGLLNEDWGDDYEVEIPLVRSAHSTHLLVKHTPLSVYVPESHMPRGEWPSTPLRLLQINAGRLFPCRRIRRKRQ